MRNRFKQAGQLAAGLAVVAALAFGVSVASAEVRARTAAPCSPLPYNGVCSSNCSASCDAIGDPYAGGVCEMYNGTNCCRCQL